MKKTEVQREETHTHKHTLPRTDILKHYTHTYTETHTGTLKHNTHTYTNTNANSDCNAS